MKLDPLEFFKKYNIDDAKFKKTKLKWDKLLDIYDKFNSTRETYQPAARDIMDRLLSVKDVHSVRVRIKDPEHLIEKIIRKTIESPERKYTIENYAEQIDDIIGVRAIHLYKSDWEIIADFIQKTWKLKEQPTANIRRGDSEKILDKYREKGYLIKEHRYGYRSIHYIIETYPTKVKFTAELQVRTIFEEGWSEIDHNIRYPYDLENPILKEYLNLFNRVAGSADEMGTYIKFLQKELFSISKNHDDSIQERDRKIEELKSKIEKLKVDKAVKREINTEIDKLMPKNYSSGGYWGGGTDSGFILGSNFYNPSATQYMTSQSDVLWSRKCAECSTAETNPLTAAAVMSLSPQFNTCPSCHRLLCNKCWPLYTSTSAVVMSMLINLDKCPRCISRESKVVGT